MPKHIPPITSERTQQATRRIAEQIGPCPDLSQSDIDEIKDEGGGHFTLFRGAEPSQRVQDTVAARIRAVRERAIAAGELGRDYAEERLRIRWE
jgi:hypothetical protein